MEGNTKAGYGRLKSVIILALALGLLGSGLRYGYWGRFQHRATEVSEGRLFQSAEMPAEDLKAFVLEHGIRSVFDLRRVNEGELKPREERTILDDLGVTYFNPGGNPMEDPEVFDGFVLAAADPANLPMLVHCQDGTGRSVLAVAIYRIELENWDNERARRASKLFSFRGAFGPTGPKGQFLRRYVPHLDSLLGQGSSESDASEVSRFKTDTRD